jgi:hypothetical protein
LLVPISHIPLIEVLGGELTCRVNPVTGNLSWQLVRLELYIEPAPGDVIAFVFHRCNVRFRIPGLLEETAMSEIRIAPPYVADLGVPRSSVYGSWKPDSVTAAHTQSEMIFQGPGRGNLRGIIETSLTGEGYADTTVLLVAELVYSHGELPVIIRAEISWAGLEGEHKDTLGRWLL